MQAIRLARRLGDQVAEAQAYLNLSVAYEQEQRPHASLRSSLRALTLAESAGHPTITAMACNNVGYLHASLGQYQDALSYCRQALRELGRPSGPSALEASIWDSLGYTHQHRGDSRQAIQSYRRAVDLFRKLGARYAQATALSHLGDAYREAGDRPAARHAWEQALAMLCDLDHPDADLTRAKLRDCPDPT